MVKYGRPTKLTEEIIQKAEGYLAFNEKEETITRFFNTKEGPQEREIRRPPTLVGLAQYLDLDRGTLNEWAKKNERFSRILSRVRQEYERVLVGYGLTEAYNPGLTKFLLSADLDKREKADLTSDGKPLPTPILNGILSHERNEESGRIAEED